MTPLIAKAAAKGDDEEVQDLLAQSLLLGLIGGLVGTCLFLFKTNFMLSSVLSVEAPAMEFAKPYLKIRSASLICSTVSLLGFSTFRGLMDTVTPLKVSALANTANAVLDPAIIFSPCRWGVSGAAIATVISEALSAGLYTILLLRKELLQISKIIRPPAFVKVKPLLIGGAAIQFRSVALNVAFLSITRATQSLDNTGVAAAAHAIGIQTFQIGGVFLLALSAVAAILVPNQLVEKVDTGTGEITGGPLTARMVSNRMMAWGLVLGSVLGGLQVLAIPFLSAFSPIEEVQKAARIPSIIACFLQVINGLVFIGEGVMQGCGDFLTLAISSTIATIGLVKALPLFTSKWGLTGVWATFFVFNGLRLTGVVIHQLFISPFSRRQLSKRK
mmetsp:Transcript_8373/g.18288  ORF Transcript_8373/g.18288 Transcript_8373/m.18288 type:complete len:388 (-) Transcript_8373:99-1262(-)